MSQLPSGFDSLGLSKPLLQAIQDSGYTQPTPIQEKSIPVVLEGRDILAAAQTGTGKTAGFTLPILHHLSQTRTAKSKAGKPRCLVLSPTRELAAQIGASVQVYGKHVPVHSLVVFGGVNIERQIRSLKKSVDIVIATPGRLIDLVNRRHIDLSQVEILVLDEADRMLDMGFIHDVKKISAMMSAKKQTLMFSATFSSQIRSLAKTLLKNPAEVSVAKTNVTTELVKQSAHLVNKGGKRALLSHLIKTNKWEQVLVFTRTKHGANRLVEQLNDDGIRSEAFHGNKSQAARTKALGNFKNGKVRVLCATDIAARGIDIHLLPQVVNFDLPLVAEDYVHRIGRTGRAGSNGQAVSLVGVDELKLLTSIEKLIKQSVEIIEVDGHTGHTDKPSPAEPRKQRPGRSSSQKRAGTSKKKSSASHKPSGRNQRSGQAKGNSDGTSAPRRKTPNGSRKPRSSAA
ncbi:MAG: DEAD/DEAH box helicase [Granulosicoccaceae bacterium]